MAKISFQHEDISANEDHQHNIDRFRNLAKEVFADDEGNILFQYITKYYQFDIIEYSDEISEDDINRGFEEIKRGYPNCFIGDMNTKPSIKMDKKLK